VVRRRTLIIVLSVAGPLAGCVSHSPYPRDWPALPAAGPEVCPAVAGRFENFVSATTDDDSVPTLSVLFGIERGGRVLEIRQSPDQKLLVKATDSLGSITLEEKALPYHCDDDGLQVTTGYALHDANVAASIERKSVHFTRATDGSLVVRRKSGQFILILGVIPGGYVSELRWYRFAPWSLSP